VTGRYTTKFERIYKDSMFQSSPGLVTGRYVTCVSIHYARITFQSSPGLVTGRYGNAAHHREQP